MRAKPSSCSGCACLPHGNDFSEVEGTCSNGVFIVGEASGQHEQRAQLPFRPFAPAGGVLERAFNRMSQKRGAFAISNILRCRPRHDWFSKSPWEYSAARHCRPNLEAEFAKYRPRVIWGLGNIPLRELTGVSGVAEEAQSISHLSGYVLPLASSRVPCDNCISYDSLEVPAKQRMTDSSCDKCRGSGYVTSTGAIPVLTDFHTSFLRRGKMAYFGRLCRTMQRALNIAQGKDKHWMWGVDPDDCSTWNTPSYSYPARVEYEEQWCSCVELSQDHDPVIWAKCSKCKGTGKVQVAKEIPAANVAGGRLQYWLHPTFDQAQSFYFYLHDNPRIPFAEDIETPESASMDEDARDGFSDTQIRQIQFSFAKWTGMALPWKSPFKEIAIKILHLPNVKYGHNWDNYDHKVLRACAAREGWRYAPDRVYDTLDMFHHWQPDLPAHLQYCASFINWPFAWKHMHTLAHEPFYGCCDVDSDLQLGEYLTGVLKKDGLWGEGEAYSLTYGYTGQEREVRPVLAAMEDRGVPVDDARRVELGAEFDKAQAKLGVEIAARAPVACQRVHPKEGYAGMPPQVKTWFKEHGTEPKNWLEHPVSELEILYALRFQDSPTKAKDGTEEEGEWYSYRRQNFQVAGIGENGEPTTQLVERWCRVYDFNPNSSQQLIAYMKAKGHPVPKSKEEDDEGNQKDTTAAKELQRLAVKTGDDFYLKVIEYRGYTKLKGTYVEGFRPHADGFVHTTFTFDTGIGQLSSRNPNCFSHDTEILTKRGWVGFPELRDDDLVAQYDTQDASISFVAPDARQAYWLDGELLRISTEERQIDLWCTADHNCLTRDRKSGTWSMKRASKYPKDAMQFNAGFYVGGSIRYTAAQVSVIAALQADGHVRKDGHGIDWGLIKQRKIERLSWALGECGIRHTRREGNFHVGHAAVPDWLKGKKEFGPWLLDMDADSFSEISKEIFLWDGCQAGRSYSSSNKVNTDWTQILQCLRGKRAHMRPYHNGLPNSVTNWQIDVSKRAYSLTTNRKVTPYPYHGTVYCVTMPKGTVVVRRNDTVCITGNCQNFTKLKPTPELAKAMRGMIAAKDGFVITEWDYKSCHALTLGYLAESPNYMRMARLDIHSFVAGHFLGLWNAHEIVNESDEQLRARFKWLKANPEWKRVRDDQAKHSILGIGNGLRFKGLFERYMENFPARSCPGCAATGKVAGVRGLKNCPMCGGTRMQSGLSIAKEFEDITRGIWPEVFDWQARMQDRAHREQCLKTEFGHVRRFYEVFRWDGKKGSWGHGDQAEEAIAFWLANIAFGHIREGLKALERSGCAERYGLFNNVHDSYMFHVREERLEEHRLDVAPILLAPSKVLTNPKVAPGGLVIDVEASWGKRWSEMQEMEVPRSEDTRKAIAWRPEVVSTFVGGQHERAAHISM